MPKPFKLFFSFSFVVILLSAQLTVQAQKRADFSKSNLVAWCIVPFDAAHRNPEQRAAMLKEAGISKLAYDWREEHIPEFDRELRALNRHKIKLEAFWMMAGRETESSEQVKVIFDFLERNQVQTQLWLMMSEWDGFSTLSQQEKVTAMAKEIRNIAEKAAELGCQVALYNHGGWFGEPENQLEIISHLGLKNVGIVYNFHHGRQHQHRFSEFYPKILPHLMALNIAGLKKGDTQRFYRTGQGNMEKAMIEQVWKSGYSGPIGIINHDERVDAKKGLMEEIEGLKWILYEIGNRKALRTYW